MREIDKNICLFVPHEAGEPCLHTIHFVFETEPQVYEGLHTEALYKLYYVYQGTGRLHTRGDIRPLKAGDVFFSFPSDPFAIESETDLQYLYISFLGARGNQLMEKVGVSARNRLFSDCRALRSVWEQGIAYPAEFSDIASEGVLLQTIAYLGSRQPSAEPIGHHRRQEAVAAAKKYIDEHFSDPEFSLKKLGDELNYNKKYVSTIFKKQLGMGIVAYLNTVRMQNACTMIRQGFTSVSDIAARCGYLDAQYFSKIFHRRLGMSPRDYMKKIREERDTNSSDVPHLT